MENQFETSLSTIPTHSKGPAGLNNHEATKRSNEPKETTRFNEFTCFPKLPLELRRKIWRFTTQIPRIATRRQIELGYVYFCGPERGGFLIERKSGNPSPPVLQVCYEARKEELLAYKLTFGFAFIEFKEDSTGIYGSKLVDDPRVYVNFNTDTIYISHDGNINGIDDTFSFPRNFPIPGVSFPIKSLAIYV